jgi:hypothetical protein
MGGDVGGAAVGERGGLERAAGLVERATQRCDRRGPAGCGADSGAASRQRRETLTCELDGVAVGPRRAMVARRRR